MRFPDQIIWNHRFDFGVPLEDISFSGDIHPRLKFLFLKAVDAVIKSGLNVEQIWSNQESLVTRLRLKEMLIFDADYQNIDNFSPTTLLWVIRHFLGLLPIPLLPQYSNGVEFDWNHLSNQCRDYLKYGRNFQEDSYILDYVIVELMSCLPCEHLYLLNYLILFMRKLIKIFGKDLHQRKMQLMAVAKYFCGSIFKRPYRPGFVEKDTLPLLIYLILKWHEILEVCAETGIFIEDSFSTEYGRFKEKRITVLPIKSFDKNNIENDKISLTKSYCKENSTQTEIINCFSKSCQTSLQYQVNNVPCIVKFENKSAQTDLLMKMDRTSQTSPQTFDYHSLNCECNNNKLNMEETFPLANSTVILTQGDMNETSQITNQDGYSYLTAPEFTSKYYSIVNDSIGNNILPEYATEGLIEDFMPRGNESELLDKTPYSFFSAIDTEDEWGAIVKETSQTMKRMDGYIYDDYDTFAKEEFNQLFDENKFSIAISQKGKEFESNNNPFRSNNKKINNVKTNKENSYVRFDDIDNIFTSNGSIHQITTKENNSDPLTRTSFSSDDKLYSPGKNSIYRETKSKIYFGLKRFKIKMSFFRRFTNKNISNKSMLDYTSFNNPKYQRIKHLKANTL